MQRLRWPCRSRQPLGERMIRVSVVECRPLDPRRSQFRRDATRAAYLIEQTLEAASGVIADGYLRLDPQEWIRAVEKRRAALGRQVPSPDPLARGTRGA